ncbi:glutamate racemase [Methyloglobulus sp.]|uniref:glutamate racemase n=1 Tax=Methyloglobulus sp. TaxID=2518622 RepID=UPI0032B81451
MRRENPIGIFDSGVGGLSVLREIRKLLPNENLLYVADSAHAPYGDKTKEFILERSTTIVDFFISRQVKAVVVACNTATGAAVKEIRPTIRPTIIAMEPAVKPASEKTKTGVIGVLATSRTLTSNNFQILLTRFSDQVKIIPQACPGLVEQVELGDLNGDKTRALVAQYVLPLITQNVDFIVLGCTHYPFLASLIQELVGSSITVIDSGSAIARELKSRLEKAEILADRNYSGSVQFWSSDETGKAKQVISQLWGDDVDLSNLPACVPI